MIRVAEERDIEQIAKIHVEVQKKIYVGIWNQPYLDSLNIEEEIQSLHNTIMRDDRIIFVYIERQEVIGFIECVFYSRWAGNGLCNTLYVKEEYQSQGIGKKLICAASKLLLSLNIISMDVYCAEGNVKAEKFYKGTGAVYDGYEKRFYTGVETISNRFWWKNIGNFESDVLLPDLQYDYQKIYEYINDSFVLFGAGNGCREFMQQLGNVSMPECIFDNNESLWGQNINGVPIKKPEKADRKIILTSSNVTIRKQLKELGYQSGDVTEYYPWHKYVNN